jgi:hypothetical protein
MFQIFLNEVIFIALVLFVYIFTKTIILFQEQLKEST